MAVFRHSCTEAQLGHTHICHHQLDMDSMFAVDCVLMSLIAIGLAFIFGCGFLWGKFYSAPHSRKVENVFLTASLSPSAETPSEKREDCAPCTSAENPSRNGSVSSEIFVNPVLTASPHPSAENPAGEGEDGTPGPGAETPARTGPVGIPAHIFLVTRRVAELDEPKFHTMKCVDLAKSNSYKQASLCGFCAKIDMPGPNAETPPITGPVSPPPYIFLVPHRFATLDEPRFHTKKCAGLAKSCFFKRASLCGFCAGPNYCSNIPTVVTRFWAWVLAFQLGMRTRMPSWSDMAGGQVYHLVVLSGTVGLILATLR